MIKIKVKNYRTFINFEKEIKNNLYTFLGKNESGKTNFLDMMTLSSYANSWSDIDKSRDKTIVKGAKNTRDADTNLAYKFKIKTHSRRMTILKKIINSYENYIPEFKDFDFDNVYFNIVRDSKTGFLYNHPFHQKIARKIFDYSVQNKNIPIKKEDETPLFDDQGLTLSYKNYIDICKNKDLSHLHNIAKQFAELEYIFVYQKDFLNISLHSYRNNLSFIKDITTFSYNDIIDKASDDSDRSIKQYYFRKILMVLELEKNDIEEILNEKNNVKKRKLIDNIQKRSEEKIDKIFDFFATKDEYFAKPSFLFSDETLTLRIKSKKYKVDSSEGTERSEGYKMLFNIIMDLEVAKINSAFKKNYHNDNNEPLIPLQKSESMKSYYDYNIILLDEPCKNLHYNLRKTLTLYFTKAIQDYDNIYIFLSTHDPILDLSDETIFDNVDIFYRRKSGKHSGETLCSSLGDLIKSGKHRELLVPIFKDDTDFLINDINLVNKVLDHKDDQDTINEMVFVKSPYTQKKYKALFKWMRKWFPQAVAEVLWKVTQLSSK